MEFKIISIILAIVTMVMLMLIVVFLSIDDKFDNIEKLTIQQSELLRENILRLNTEERILKIIIETTLDTNSIIIRRVENE